MGAIVEGVIATAAFTWLIAHSSLRALWWAGMRAILGGAWSMFALAPADPATLWSGLVVATKITLLLAPPLRMWWRAPRHRLAWIPLAALLWPGMLGNALPGITGIGMWILFLVAAGGAWVAVRRPALAALALLPWLVGLEPLLGHGPLSDVVWRPSRLGGRCASNDGVRPVDFTPEFAGAHYYSVTPLSPELMLLAGERRSFWVRRAADGSARLGPPLPLHANYWQGCVKDGTVWVTSRGFVCEAAPPSHHQCHPAPGPADTLELDYLDALCLPDRQTILVGQLLRGGVLEFDPRTESSTFHPIIPGMNLQLALRRDGQLVGITTSRLVVFDPKSDRVLSNQAAGLVAMGHDVCEKDDAAIVTDFVGRVRLFERTGDGGYRFRAGAFVPAARRVAFSPSCDRLIVTSGDDRHAFLLRRDNLQILQQWKLGPGLRDVVFLDEHTATATDACTVSLLKTDQ